jgi:hypothetical protein
LLLLNQQLAHRSGDNTGVIDQRSNNEAHLKHVRRVYMALDSLLLA